MSVSRVGVFAVGSGHGDDRAGWDAVRLAAGRLPPGAGVAEVRNPLDLTDLAGRWDAVVVVDACRGAGVAGSVHRFGWPDGRLERVGSLSSHGFGLAAALDLAARLGRLPPRVTVFAVEAGPMGLGDGLSPAVAAAAPALADAVVAEAWAMFGGEPGGAMSDPSLLGTETLRSLAFFAAMPEENLGALAAAAQQECHAAGAVVFREGDHLERFYVVADGTVAVEILGPDRRPKRLQTVGPGELLGWSPVLGLGAMTATARALTPVRAIAFDAVAMRAAFDADPKLGYLFLRRVAAAVAGRLNATRLQLLDVYRHDLPDAPMEGVAT